MREEFLLPLWSHFVSIFWDNDQKQCWKYYTFPTQLSVALHSTQVHSPNHGPSGSRLLLGHFRSGYPLLSAWQTSWQSPTSAGIEGHAEIQDALATLKPALQLAVGIEKWRGVKSADRLKQHRNWRHLVHAYCRAMYANLICLQQALSLCAFPFQVPIQMFYIL